MKIHMGNMFTTVDFEGNVMLKDQVRTVMHKEMGVKVEGSHFSRAFRNGVWDGITDFYDMKHDKFHTGLIHQFLEGLKKLQAKDPNLTYEVIDERNELLVDPEDIDEKIVLENGDEEPITLRDYQYDSVKAIFKERVGIVNLATNAGKTETAAGFMQQIKDHLDNGERIAFFTHSSEILQQSSARIAKRLGMQDYEIGIVGNGKFDVKNKKIVFVMVPTLNSALKDPKKGINFTHKEKVVKFIAEEIAPKFKNGTNTRHLLRNYLKNCQLTTKIYQSAEEQLQYIAYDKKFTDSSAQMQLNRYVVEFDKIMEKKAKAKYKKYKDAKDFLDSVKVMIADEVHHLKAETWFTIFSLCENAEYKIGLTGTVDKKDKMKWQRLQAMFCQIISRVSNDYLIEKGISSKPVIRLIPIKEPTNLELMNTYLEAYKAGIVDNEHRNQIIGKIVAAYKKGKPGGVLISVKEIEHGDKIMEILKDKGMDVDFIHGGSDSTHREQTLERFSKGQLEIMIASTIVDEGVDMKSIGCMVLAAGGKSMRQQLQRIGRGLRLNGIDGNQVMVFDFYDQTNKFLLNHSKERVKIFKQEKFDVKVLNGK